jgi:hypothetical protein
MTTPYLHSAIRWALSEHYGRANPIARVQLLHKLARFQISDRKLRAEIRALRRSGHLIGSAAGADGGYYLITTMEEFEEFLRTEFVAKVQDMRETANAMTLAAEQQFEKKPVQMQIL